MRTDISQEIISKTSDRLQTSAYDSEPKLSLVISRKEVFLDDFSFTERRRARHTTLNSISDIGIAIYHPKLAHEDESVWISYIKDGKLYLRYSSITGDISIIDWEEIDLGEPSATKCDVGFYSNIQTNDRGVVEYVSRKKPIVFYLSSGTIYYIDTSEANLEPHSFSGSNIKDLSVRQTNAGLGLFYVKTDNEVYYRIKGVTGWSAEEYINESPEVTVDGISTFATLDGFGVQVHSGSKLYRIIGDENFAFDEWFEVGDATGTGAIVEYPDGQKEAFFDAEIASATGEAGGLCYSKGNDEWFFNASNQLYEKHYAVIEFDHTNQGTVYFTTLLHSETEGDIIYFLRYMYSKDVSTYTQEVSKKLQIDNPISQINAELKNIDDTLYVSNATIFAPSSMMRLGVKYGSSEMVDLGLGYIDQTTFEHGGKTVSISGRNRTGVYLRDQTFGEDLEFNDTPYNLVEQIMTIFGLEDCYECDDSEYANGTEGNPRIITLTVKAKTTGLKALETLNELLTDDNAGRKWDFEELPDGTIIVGYDDFRSQYNPKSNYIFNGMNDVFAKAVDRSIDGVYSRVRCTGTTLKGKEISYTYKVTNFRFWEAGENRIYHAPHIDGITKTELKAYAKALAKQLKYIGRIITYTMNLKPQLVIGDVARITYGQDEGETEQLGTITEINHTLGEKGCFTEFTITSGGNVTDVSPSVVYVADKSATGTNRKRRMSDYFGGTSESEGISANSTVINYGNDFDYIERVRNNGERFLDEPTNVRIEYDEDENEVHIKWEDPNDLSDFKPIPLEWLGTVVVRNENGAPKNPYDGLQIVDSKIRDQYKNDWLVDDNSVQRGNIYYYAIMPYCMKLDDATHPLYRYRYTKVVSVNTGLDLQPAIITNLEVDGVKVTVSFEIPALRNGSYANITLVAKKDGTPLNVDDGDEFITLTDSDTSAIVSRLSPESTYYFVIFSEDEQGNVAVSDAVNCKTGEKTEWNLSEVALTTNMDNVKTTHDSSLRQLQEYWGTNNILLYSRSTNGNRLYEFDGNNGNGRDMSSMTDGNSYIPIEHCTMLGLECDIKFDTLTATAVEYLGVGVYTAYINGEYITSQICFQHNAYPDHYSTDTWYHYSVTFDEPRTVDYIMLDTCDGLWRFKDFKVTLLT